jgi:hypothetical protein
MPAGNRKLLSETHVAAAERAIVSAIAPKRGAQRCFRYWAERHDIGKVTVSFKFVKNYFIDIGGD